MKEFFKEHTLNIGVAIIFAFAGGILGYWTTSSKEVLTVGKEAQVIQDKVILTTSDMSRWALTLSWGLIWALLSLILVDYGKSIIRGKRDRKEFLSTVDAQIQNRLERMIEYVAFYTESGKLERAISTLRGTQGKKSWIIAKFISKQLSDNFSSFKIDIDGDDYSKFAESLFKECEKSICLSSPFTPVEWFRQLYADKADQVIDIINKSRNMSKTIKYIESKFGIPSHVKSLAFANIETKKRLVILPSRINTVLIAQEKFLHAFLEMNKGIETKFVEREALCSNYGFACSAGYDFSKYDYAIFDGEIVLKWERPTRPNEERPLLLIDLKNIQGEDKNIYEKIKDDVFDFKNKWFAASEINDTIVSEKANIKNKIKEKKDLPHKFAYFGSGASAWVTICKDIDYDLGRREISTLRKILEKIEERCTRTDKWNVLHLGSGQGREIPIIVEILGSHRMSSYTLIDVSPELLQLAESFAVEKYKNINFSIHVLDVAEDKIMPVANEVKKGEAKKNLIFMVGNGAILMNTSVFYHIKESMGADDIFILTLETYDPARTQEILCQYRIPSIVNLIVQPLLIIGIDENSSKGFLEVKYNENKSLVEVWFSFKKWLDNNSARSGEFTEFPDSFRIFASFRPTPQGLKELLVEKGFKIELFEYFEQEHCCGVLCSVDNKQKLSSGSYD